ncbi:MAG: HAD-IIB family hydrolase [Patescibacteria group bacterium]
MIPSVVMFDIDKTLARSKSDIEPLMSEALARLLIATKVGIISGGKLEQFMKQVVGKLPPGTPLFNLYLLPTSGGALYEYRSAWMPIYQELLEADEVERIQAAMEEVIDTCSVIDRSHPPYGDRIEVRGPQVTLSALGQQAPVKEKEAWDPVGTKREILRAALAKRLPEFDVKRGGSTSIDVTKRGVNKAFGVRKLSEHLSIPVGTMLYVGDALAPGGNDEVVKETGIPTRSVLDPDETLLVIEGLLKGA